MSLKRNLRSLGKIPMLLLSIHGCGLPMNLAVIEKKDIQHDVSAAGRVHGVQEANISPEIGAKVGSWQVRTGDKVKKGDVVVQLVHQEISSLFEESKIDLENKQRNLQLKRDLFDRHMISGKEFSDYTYLTNRSLATFNTMAAKKEMLTIKAPFDGVLVKRFKELGEMAIQQEVLFTIANLDRLKLTLEVDEAESGLIKVGQRVKFSTEANGGTEFQGQVASIGMAIEKKRESQDDGRDFNETHILPIEVETPFDPRLKVGQSTTGKVEIVPKTKILAVPRKAVFRSGSLSYVHILKYGLIKQRTVNLGISNEQYFEVKNGVLPGEKVLLQ